MALPPVPEQRSIVRRLEQETVRLDNVAEKARHSLILLKERRTALISAAVTGKIDVRDWKPPKSARAAEVA